jgi:cytochrome c553
LFLVGEESIAVGVLRLRVWLGGLVVLTGVCAVAARAADEAPDREELDFFERKIRPVLVEHCYSCHSETSKEVKGGLRLDLREASRRGGESGPAIVPGKPEESLLLSALRYQDLQMPPAGKLSDETIADFTRWIAMGAPDPRDGDLPPVSTPSFDVAEARRFWAFQPPRRHPVPQGGTPETVERPIDGFLLAELTARGLAPSPPADRRTLIRRLTFDLIGLPPTPAEVEQFLADDAPDAYDRLVERLLASPQYGERWARLWLDVMRYAEDQAHIVGNDRSLCYPNAHRYRDWVIAALNADLPYDEFLRRQLATDLLAPDDREEYAALGFMGLGPKYYRRNAPEVMAEEWEDRVDVVTRGVLGLTVACARCHDHKYDPLTQADYYALAGVFASTEMYNQPLTPSVELDKNGHAKNPEHALHIVRDKEARDLPIYARGDVTRPGAVVSRRFLRILSDEEPPAWQEGSGRKQLADALVDPRNPLTARVLVNRVWNWHFGRGLVATPSNFGMLGERPSHPELLDDLAVRFMEHGWSLKWLQREIVLSAAYRRSSHPLPDVAAADPANVWLARMPRRRLSIEQWRDAVLAVSGQLDPQLGGPSIEPHDPQATRRTVYSRISRLELNALLARFDFPDPNTHSDRRTETTTPLQKLFVLNSPFMDRQAGLLAERLRQASASDSDRLRLLYQLLFSREPQAAEELLVREFLAQEPGEDRRWAQLAQVLLASNEFLLLD